MVKVQDMSLSQLKKRKAMYGLGSWLVTAGPSAAVILSKWSVYTKDGGGFKLGLGGLLLGALLLITFLGKIKIPGRVVVTGVICVLVYLLNAVIADLPLLSGVVFGSVAADSLWTGRMSEKLSKELELREAADRAGKATLEGIKEYLKQGGSDA